VRFLQDRRTVFALLDRRLWPKSRVPRKEKFPHLVCLRHAFLGEYSLFGPLFFALLDCRFVGFFCENAEKNRTFLRF
jgi:hypothetical protein